MGAESAPIIPPLASSKPPGSSRGAGRTPPPSEPPGNGSPPGGAAGGSPPAAEPEVSLVRKVVCPHCWHTFRPEQILWVAEHEELIGDPVLKDEPIRFLPTRFTLEGNALDAREQVCRTLACPQCHLVIPRVLLENEITFLSLIGSVGSGKSNFLAAMTWELRQKLAKYFAVTFSDGDKEANWVLNRYEEQLFLPDDPERPTILEKTRTQGDLYRSVRLHGQEVQVPKPFLFTMHPGGAHPWARFRRRAGSIVCMYDNAGEHYAVGQDTQLSPVTRHLSKSKVLMFLFDPTQDPRFRERCKRISRDPQVVEPLHTIRQENILAEAALRVRKHRGLSAYERHNAPLLVLVAKSDIWSSLISADIRSEPYLPPDPKNPSHRLATVDMPRVEDVSVQVRQMLLDHAPEVVTTAEDFCEEVVYIPVSALGASPEKSSDGLVVKPRNVRPRWVTVPLLYSYARWATGLIHGTRP